MKIAVIDYGAGNLNSVVKALDRLGYPCAVTESPQEVLDAPVVVCPGVGAAADAMKRLRELHLDDAIREVIAADKPFLGICLGLQLLLDVSNENGRHKCLGIIPGSVKKLPSGLKVPHMGWNQVRQTVKHPIFEGVPDGSNFYFVHSYYGAPDDGSVVAGETGYGVTFASSLIKGNMVATQFHPEKSGAMGLKLLDNFLKWSSKGGDR